MSNLHTDSRLVDSMRMRTLETCFGATVTSFSVVFLFIPFKFFFLIFLCPVVLIIHHYYHGMLHHITKITSKHTNHKSPVQSNLRWDCDTKLPVISAITIDIMRNIPATLRGSHNLSRKPSRPRHWSFMIRIRAGYYSTHRLDAPWTTF